MMIHARLHEEKQNKQINGTLKRLCHFCAAFRCNNELSTELSQNPIFYLLIYWAKRLKFKTLSSNMFLRFNANMRQINHRSSSILFGTAYDQKRTNKKECLFNRWQTSSTITKLNLFHILFLPIYLFVFFFLFINLCRHLYTCHLYAGNISFRQNKNAQIVSFLDEHSFDRVLMSH